MVTTELRRDPITGRHVLVDRAPFRRDEFELEPVRLEDAPSACLLCEGREAEAGAEILAWREGAPANAPGWSVRVVPHRHPMLRIEGGMEITREGLFEVRDGLGAHEVIVETPLHDQPLQGLDTDRVWRVFWAWRARVRDLKRDARFASAIIFKNHGRAAGARVDHAHSQLVAYPVVPPALAEQVAGAMQGYAATGRCVFCDLVGQEAGAGERIVWDGDGVIAMAPYASRVPFEVSMVPRDHSPRFEEASDDTLKALAEAFRCVMPAVDWALERPAYNVVLHTAPFDGSADPALHWRLDILPRVTRFSGREWATGMYRNPVAPEEAARVLRQTVKAGV
jgi:UDPglucose--hexose-1-phosphate uridylyltransferase